MEVRLASADGRTTLEVTDDGGGFDPDRTRPGSSMGLGSMRERAQALGGTFQVRSRPGEGARVEVTISLDSSSGAKGTG